MNSLSFCLLGKSLTLPHFWRTALPGIEYFTDRFFSFNIFNMPWHSSWPKNPYWVFFMWIFSLFSCYFQNFLVFDFWQFNYNMSWSRPIQVQLIWDLLGLMDLDVHFSPQVWEIFSHYCFKYTSCPFLSSSSGIPIMWILFLLIVSHKSCRLSSPLFILFSFYSSE